MSRLLDTEADQSGEDSGEGDEMSEHSSDADADASDPGPDDEDFSHRAVDEAFRRENDRRDLMSSSEDEEEESRETQELLDKPPSEPMDLESEHTDSESVRAPKKKSRITLDSDDEQPPAQQTGIEDAQEQVGRKHGRSFEEDDEPASKRARPADWLDVNVSEDDGDSEQPLSVAKEDFELLFRSEQPLEAPPGFSAERAMDLLEHVFAQCEALRAIDPGDHAQLAERAALFFNHQPNSNLCMLNAKMNSGLVLVIDKLLSAGVMVPNTPEGNLLHGKGIVIQEVLRLCFSVLSLTAMQQRVKNIAAENSEGNTVSLAISGAPDMSEWQSLLLRMCKYFGAAGLRRYKGDVFDQIRVMQVEDIDGMRSFVPTRALETMNPSSFKVLSGPFDTHAWENIGTIEDVLYKMCNKDCDFELFRAMTKAGGHTIMSITKFMEKMSDHDFPELVPNRGWRSFSNGVLSNVDGLKFYEYGKHRVPGSVISCAFYKMAFPLDALDFKDWYNIPTPKLTNILAYQTLEPEVQRVVWALFGRLAYKVGDRDKWQVLMMIIGVAGSGKSTLANVFARLFDPSHVATMSSNIEVKFGLAPLKDAYLCICPEVTKDTEIQRGDLQSMTGGDQMRLAEKGKPSINHVWHSHLLFLGNGPGNWADLNNSIGRRFVTLMFMRQVRETKPDLDRELLAELPYIIAKCLLAYQDCSHRHANRGVWNWLPPYFKATQERMLAQINPVRAFLNDRSLVMVNPNERLLLSTAFSMYRRFERNNAKFAVENFTEDMLSEAIQDHLGLKLDYFHREGDKIAGTYIIGLMSSAKGDLDQPEPSKGGAKKSRPTEHELNAEVRRAAETPVEYPKYGLDSFLQLFDHRKASVRTRVVVGMHRMVDVHVNKSVRRRSVRALPNARPGASGSSSSTSSSSSSTSSSSSSTSSSSSSTSSSSSSTSSSSSSTSSSSSSTSSSSSSTSISPSSSSSTSSSSSSSSSTSSPSSSSSSSSSNTSFSTKRHTMPMVFDPASKFKIIQN